jgi:hypothetical protein
MDSSMTARDTVTPAPGRELVLIGGLLRFCDDFRREWLEVPVAVDLGQAIARLDAAAQKREQRHRARVKTFTDLAGPKR